jgi:hypothetical protein
MIHFGVGVGSMLLALALFDFPTPRWISWLGATGLAGFGAILTLQGIAEVTNIQAIWTLAFDVLGQQAERYLPDLFIVASAAFVFAASQGRSRLFGIAAVAVAIGIEVAIYGGPFLGIEVPNPKLHLALPVAVLLVESLKAAEGDRARSRREAAGAT